MVYSAQLTSLQTYPVPKNWFPGKKNTLQVPIINPTLTHAKGFELDGRNNLRFTGPNGSHVLVKAKLAFGAMKPSAIDPTAALDKGPGAEVYAYVQVGQNKGVRIRLDETVYYPAYEWPLIRYTLDLEDIFQFNQGDSIKCYMYYKWTVAPRGPVNKHDFYLQISACNLSFVALSSDHAPTTKEQPPFTVPKIEEVKVNPPISTPCELYRFKPGVSGLQLISVRMTIKKALIVDTVKKFTSLVISSTWQAWLTVNGSPEKQNLSMQVITNQPNIINTNDTVWPNCLDLYLLAEVKETDEVSVMAQMDGCLITDPVKIFAMIKEGTYPMTISFLTFANQGLLPQIQTMPEYNETLVLDVDGKMGEFPIDGRVAVASHAPPYRFNVRDGQVVFASHQPRWFKVRATLILAQILLNTANKDPAIVVNQNLGIAIGVNGAKQNNIEESHLVYSDTTVLHKWMATQSAENFVCLKPGDRLSVLLWTDRVVYLNVPPNASAKIPNKTPPAGSTVVVNAQLSVVVEDA